MIIRRPAPSLFMSEKTPKRKIKNARRSSLVPRPYEFDETLEEYEIRINSSEGQDSGQSVRHGIAGIVERPNRPRKPFIEPINPYTGKVSVLAIAYIIRNGYDTFPDNIGESIREH